MSPGRAKLMNLGGSLYCALPKKRSCLLQRMTSTTPPAAAIEQSQCWKSSQPESVPTSCEMNRPASGLHIVARHVSTGRDGRQKRICRVGYFPPTQAVANQKYRNWPETLDHATPLTPVLSPVSVFVGTADVLRKNQARKNIHFKAAIGVSTNFSTLPKCLSMTCWETRPTVLATVRIGFKAWF